MDRLRDIALVGGLVSIPVAIGVSWWVSSWYFKLPTIEYCFDEGKGDILHDRSIRDWFNNARLSGNYLWKDRILQMEDAQADIEHPITLGDFTIELTLTPLRDDADYAIFYLEQSRPEWRYVHILQGKSYGNVLVMRIYTGKPYPISRVTTETRIERGRRLHVAFTRKVGEYVAVYREEGGIWYLEGMEKDESPLPVSGRARLGWDHWLPPLGGHNRSFHIWENFKIYPYITIEVPTVESKTEY